MSPEYLPLAERIAAFGVPVLCVSGMALLAMTEVLRPRIFGTVFTAVSFLIFILCCGVMLYSPGNNAMTGNGIYSRDGTAAAALVSLSCCLMPRGAGGFFHYAALMLCAILFLPVSGFKTIALASGLFAAAVYAGSENGGKPSFFIMSAALFFAIYHALPVGQAGKNFFTASAALSGAAVFFGKTSKDSYGFKMAEIFTFAALYLMILSGPLNAKAAVVLAGAAIAINSIKSMSEEDSGAYFEAERRGVIFMGLLAASCGAGASAAVFCTACLAVSLAASRALDERGNFSVGGFKFSHRAEKEGVLVLAAVLPLFAAETVFIYSMIKNVRPDEFIKAAVIAAGIPYCIVVLNRLFTAVSVFRRSFAGGKFDFSGTTGVFVLAAAAAVVAGVLS